MKKDRAIEILRLLAGGVDPATGEIIGQDHFLRSERMQAALECAVSALQEAEPQPEMIPEDCARRPAVRQRGRGGRYFRPAAKPQEPQPVFPRSGLPWETSDDQRLAELARKRVPVREIALELKRTPYAVFSRMEKKNLYGKQHGYPARDEKGHWTDGEIEILRQMNGEGRDALEIADALQRPFYNVRMRIGYIALSHRMMEDGGEGDA